MQLEIHQKLEKWIKIYGPIVPVLLAMIPFVLSLLMSLVFTHGNTKTAAYILTNVGIITIWTQGLVTLISILLQLAAAFTFVLALVFWKEYKALCTTLIFIAAIFIATVMPVVLAALISIGYIIITISSKYSKKRNAKDIERLKKIKKDLPDFTAEELSQLDDFLDARIAKAERKSQTAHKMLRLNTILFVASVVVTILFSYPTTQLNVISFEKGDTLKGYILNESTVNIIFYKSTERSITLISRKDIKSQTVCREPSISLITESLVDITTNKALLPLC